MGTGLGAAPLPSPFWDRQPLFTAAAVARHLWGRRAARAQVGEAVA